MEKAVDGVIDMPEVEEFLRLCEKTQMFRGINESQVNFISDKLGPNVKQRKKGLLGWVMFAQGKYGVVAHIPPIEEFEEWKAVYYFDYLFKEISERFGDAKKVYVLSKDSFIALEGRVHESIGILEDALAEEAEDSLHSSRETLLLSYESFLEQIAVAE